MCGGYDWAMITTARQHEEFCQRRVSADRTGESVLQSYTAIWGDDGTSDTVKLRRANSISQRPKIKNRIAQLRSVAFKAELTKNHSIEEVKGLCSQILNAKPSEAGPENPLCELKMGKLGPYYVFPDKLRTAEFLAKLNGWTQDMSVNVNVPSWSPSSEENVNELPPMEGEIILTKLGN